MYATTRRLTVKSGAQISNGGEGTTGPPPLATALVQHVCVYWSCNNRFCSFWHSLTLHSCESKVSQKTQVTHPEVLRGALPLKMYIDMRFMHSKRWRWCWLGNFDAADRQWKWRNFSKWSQQLLWRKRCVFANLQCFHWSRENINCLAWITVYVRVHMRTEAC